MRRAGQRPAPLLWDLQYVLLRDSARRRRQTAAAVSTSTMWSTSTDVIIGGGFLVSSAEPLIAVRRSAIQPQKISGLRLVNFHLAHVVIGLPPVVDDVVIVHASLDLVVLGMKEMLV